MLSLEFHEAGATLTSARPPRACSGSCASRPGPFSLRPLQYGLVSPCPALPPPDTSGWPPAALALALNWPPFSALSNYPHWTIPFHSIPLELPAQHTRKPRMKRNKIEKNDSFTTFTSCSTIITIAGFKNNIMLNHIALYVCTRGRRHETRKCYAHDPLAETTKRR
jgi:hypothetical protein